MIESTEDTSTRSGPEGPGQPSPDLAQIAREAGTAAQERVGDLRDAAQSTLDDAKSAAADKADEAKGQAADEIARTAHGLEAAAQEMEGSPVQQDLLREAAEGLKQISRAMQGKSVGAMVADLSDFGRNNPVAYLGGAALAGFVLARFARASADNSHHQEPHRNDAAPSDRSDLRGTERQSPGFVGGPENAR